MTWEYARLASAQVAATLAASCALAALFHYSLAPLGERRDRIAFIGLLVMLLIFNVATLLNCREGGLSLRFERRLYRLPLPTRWLVAGRMLPALVAVAFMVLVQASFMRFGVGARWPILAPLLLTMAVLAWTHALGWSLGGRPLLLVPVAFGSLIVLRRWVAPRLLVEQPMAELPGADAAALMATILVSVVIATAGVGRDRAGLGHTPSRWRMPRWSRVSEGPASAWEQAEAGVVPPPIGSAARAQIWMEWREKGWILPVWAVAALCSLAAIMLATRSPDRVVGALLSYPLLVAVITPPVVGFMFGRFSKSSKVDAIDPFRARLPLRDERLARLMLVAGALTLAATWLATLVAVEGALLALTMAGYPMNALDAGRLAAGGIGSENLVYLLVGIPLYAWSAMGLTLGLAVTGRNWVIGSFAAVPYSYVGLSLVAARIFRVDLYRLVVPWLLPLFVVGLPIAATALALLAVRQRLVRRASVAALFAAWLAMALVVAIRSPTLTAELTAPGVPTADRLRALALPVALILPSLPPILAPVAIWWNRHR